MANQVVTKIQFRRGPESERLAIENLGAGEPIFSTDSTGASKFFIGDGSTPGGLGIKELCYNPTAPAVISLSEGDLSFNNGILESFTKRVVEEPGNDLPGVVSNIKTSNSDQYVQEIYTNISTPTQSDVSVLVRAIKYVNGVVTGVANGPGQLLQYRKESVGAFLPLVNDTSFAAKEDGVPSTWFISLNDVTLRKERNWMRLYSIVAPSGDTDFFDSWIYVTTEDVFHNPQHSHNDATWIYIKDIAGGENNGQWVYTGMSLYPYMWIEPRDGNDILGLGTGGWSYVKSNSDGYWLFNFSDSRWYRHDRSIAGSAVGTTTPDEPVNSNAIGNTGGLETPSL